MDSDNKLRELLELEKTNVPDFLDWSEMETGIKEKMVIMDSAKGSIKRREWLRRFFFLSLGLLLLVPLTCGPEEADIVNNSKVKEQQNPVGLVPTSEAYEEKSTIVSSPVSDIPPSVGSPDASDNVINPYQLVLAGTTDYRRESIAPLQVVTELSKEADSRVTRSFASLPPAPSKLLVMIDSDLQRQDYNAPTPIEKNKHRSNMISVFASPGTWNTGWGSNTPINVALEKELWSLGFGLNYTRKMKKGLLLNIGFQYQRLERKLDWSDLIEEYTYVLTDTIIGFEHNNVTSELSSIIGDTTFTVYAERQVTHFNRSEVLQIPIGIGYSRSFGRIRTNIIGGTAFGVWKKHEGISLQDGFIEDYSIRPVFNTDVSFSGFIDIGVSYDLSEQISIGTSFMIQKEYSNWSYLDDVSIRPTVFNTKFIVSYSL